MSDVVLIDVKFPDLGPTVTQANVALAQVKASTQLNVENALALGRLLCESWETFFSRSESGVAERARALRGDFIQRLRQSLELARFSLVQATGVDLLVGEPLRVAGLLANLIAALESVQRQALSQWGISEEIACRLGAMPDVPLKLDNNGDIHVGNSRVLLDTVIEHFKAGMSPEEIVRGYDTLRPAEIYEVIAYYLRHQADVEAYLERREAEAAVLWQQIEASQPSKANLKDEIEERWSKRKADRAVSAE
jgi:uncharacterized protein (DUF433 family)